MHMPKSSPRIKFERIPKGKGSPRILPRDVQDLES